jgi:hypothetical protein
MGLSDYLNLVGRKIDEAAAKGDLVEVVRLIEACVKALDGEREKLAAKVNG